MADQDGYSPNPSDESFNSLIEAEFSAGQNRPTVERGGQLGGVRRSGNPDLDRDARARQEEAARHDYQGADASEMGGSAESSAGQQAEQSEDGGLEKPKRWQNAVTGGRGQLGGAKKGGFKGFMKKRVPTIVIVAVVSGAGITLFATPTMQGFAIVNRLIQEFNSMGTVSSARSTYFLQRILSGSKTKTDTVLDDDKFMLGDTELASLRANDIDIIDGEDGTHKMTYRNGDDLHIIDADDFNRAKAELPDFDNKLTSGTATYSNQNTGWYDKLTSKFLSKIGLGRNRFNNYEQTGDAAADDAKFKEVADTDKTARGSKDQSAQQFEEEDDTGKKKRGADTGELSADEDLPVRGDSEEVVKQKLNSKASKVVGGAAGLADQACQVMTIASTINDLANAAELIQVLNFANGFMEAVQKVQAGLGAEAPMQSYLTRLNKVDSKTGKTGMQSAGMSQLFGGVFDHSDESAKSLNFESSHHKLFGMNINSMTASDFEKCSYARVADGTFETGGAIVFALSLTNPATASVTVGLALLKAAGTAVTAAAISMVIEALAPRVASLIAMNLIGDDTLGPILGNALSIRNYLATNHKQRGGSGGDKNAVLAFNRETEKVIAHQAEYERATKSPFDVTSQYTFLGTLYSSLLPLMSSSGSVVGSMSGLSSVIVGSLGKIMPSAAAATLENTYLTTTQGDCPISDEVEVFSDEFCSPVIISDVSTMNMDPAEVYQIVAKLDNGNNFKGIDSSGNPQINLKSNLGKFLVYCGQRQVNYGYADANAAASEVFSNGRGNTTEEAVYNTNVTDPSFNIPTSGGEDGSSSGLLDRIAGFFRNFFHVVSNSAFQSVQDIFSGLTDIHNAQWISGLNCVDTPKNTKWDSEMKYYQRYLEDQGIMEAMGIVEQSALEVALDEWYEENPINTYEDALAYYSGHSKAEVELALDYVDYYEALAQYHPQNMAPLPLEAPAVTVFQMLFNADDFTFIQMQEPLVAGASELEREVAFRQDKRTVDQSI